MKLQIIGIYILLSLTFNANSQTKSTKPLEKATKKTIQAKEASDKAVEQTTQMSDNAKAVANNVNSIVKLFEPISRIHLKRKKPISKTQSNKVLHEPEGDQTENTSNSDSGSESNTEEGSSTTDVSSDDGGYSDPGSSSGDESVYNEDGTANLGSQNNSEYGCYLDMLTGTVMDDIDAADKTNRVDLIFTATSAFNEQLPMYAFLTPAYVKEDAFAYNFFKGVKYKDRNIPPASWTDVNESELAMTTLKPAQFEKINNNNQLSAVVKQIKGFGPKVESRSKLEGKVIAVRANLKNRTVYGLILITEHIGTTGASGYVKVKIKVTGIDTNSDGIADEGAY